MECHVHDWSIAKTYFDDELAVGFDLMEMKHIVAEYCQKIA